MIDKLERGVEWLRGHGFTPCLGTDGCDGWEKTDGDVRLFAWWNAGGVWFCTASTPRCLAVKTAELVECAISHALLEVGRGEEMVRNIEEERGNA